MRLRASATITAPTVEPVSLAEAKLHLRLTPDQEDDDAYIVGLIATGRALCERRLGVALAPKQLRAVYDNEEPPIDWRLAASFMPTLTIQSTQYRAALGITEPYVVLPQAPLLYDDAHPLAVAVDDLSVAPVVHTTVATDQYYVDADSQPGVVRFRNMPYVAARGTLTVTYWAGPRPGQRIAPQLRSAILLMVGHLYLHREAVSADRMEELPLAVDALLASESVTGRY